MPRKSLQLARPPLPVVLEFLRVIWELNHRLEMTSSEMLRTKGMTAQQRMLMRVIDHFGTISAGALASTVHLHPGTLSTSLRRMEERKFIRRFRSTDDARRVMIELTALGAKIAGDSSGTVEEAVAHALDATPPARVRSTSQVLRRISAALAEAAP